MRSPSRPDSITLAEATKRGVAPGEPTLRELFAGDFAHFAARRVGLCGRPATDQVRGEEELVSRLSNQLRQVETLDLRLATDLWREVDALSARRAFGLNFERHIPKTPELPGRPVRRGDKVRFRPERGEKSDSVDRRLWWVNRIRQTDDGPVADFVRRQDSEAEPQTASRVLDDAVVIAQFRDPIYWCPTPR